MSRNTGADLSHCVRGFTTQGKFVETALEIGGVSVPSRSDDPERFDKRDFAPHWPRVYLAGCGGGRRLVCGSALFRLAGFQKRENVRGRSLGDDGARALSVTGLASNGFPHYWHRLLNNSWMVAKLETATGSELETGAECPWLRFGSR